MAMSPIMLTAWAVAEIPGLQIEGYRDTSTADLDRVTCRTSDGAVVSITSPLSAEAAQIQDREHRVGQFLSAGVRERLGFDVPHTLGAGVLDKRRVVVTEEAQGQPMSKVRDVRPLLPSLALALSSLHSLPTTIVKRDAVPTKTALDAVREAAGAIDRAHQTTQVPSGLLDRWDAAIEDKELWQFVPTITHGNLEFESILVDGESVVSIINWADACVGDPAVDLSTVVGPLAPEVSAGFVTDYIAHRSNNDRRVGHRARLLSELSIARWLVHCVDAGDEKPIADAVTMLNNLLVSVADNPATALGAMPAKPVNLLVDVPAPAADSPADTFVDDAPTLVAPAHSVVESQSIELEPSPVEATVPHEADSVIVDATLVEAFFSDEAEEKSDNRDGPREDEIL
jgi:aminoglycoside phosphotransferase